MHKEVTAPATQMLNTWDSFSTGMVSTKMIGVDGPSQDPLLAEMTIHPASRVVLASIIVSAGMAPAPAAQRAPSKPVKVVVVTFPPASAWSRMQVPQIFQTTLSEIFSSESVPFTRREVFEHISIVMCCLPNIIVNTIAVGMMLGVICNRVSIVHPPPKEFVTAVAKPATAVVPAGPGQCSQLHIRQGQVSVLYHLQSEQGNVRGQDILPDSTKAHHMAKDDQKANCVQGTVYKFPTVFCTGGLKDSPAITAKWAV